jgi:hypothetical protein
MSRAYHLLDLVADCKIGGYRQGVPAGRSHSSDSVVNHAGRLLRVFGRRASSARHVTASFSQGDCGSRPNAATGAGYERYLVLEIHLSSSVALESVALASIGYHG